MNTISGKELATQCTILPNARPPSEARFEPVRNDFHPQKPGGGFWSSTFLGYSVKGVSDWFRWTKYEMPHKPDHRIHLLIPHEDARILVIDTRADLVEFLATYDSMDREVPAYGQNDVDWIALSRDFDAVHLTLSGSRALHHGNPNFNSWDTESTVWLKWGFKSIEAGRQVRMFEPNGEGYD